MTKQDLQALITKLPADTLYSPAAIARHLAAGGVGDTTAAIAYCVQQGWLDQREQFGVCELWRDSKPHHRATIQSAPRVVRFNAPMHTSTQQAVKPKQPTRKTTKPQQGGLF